MFGEHSLFNFDPTSKAFPSIPTTMPICNGLTQQGKLCKRNAGKDSNACRDHAGTSWLKGQITLKFQSTMGETEALLAMEHEWLEREELLQIDEASVLSGSIRRSASAPLISAALHQKSPNSSAPPRSLPSPLTGNNIKPEGVFSPLPVHSKTPTFRMNVPNASFLSPRPSTPPIDLRTSNSPVSPASEEWNLRFEKLVKNLPRLDAAYWNMTIDDPKEDLYDLTPEQLKIALTAPYIPLRDRLHEIVTNCAQTIEHARRYPLRFPAATPELRAEMNTMRQHIDSHRATLADAGAKYQQLQIRMDQMTAELAQMKIVAGADRAIQGNYNDQFLASIAYLDVQLQVMHKLGS